ncbi:MAG TPA: gluconate 2-dehydrogenase subunit 3 family protein [Longimicrobiales bacterium]|nr:gluconate 2-dehydrogenase subunit 3 family protein [Longimicrobiales bacterium]
MAEDALGIRIITRREALRRTALLLGGAVSAPTLAGVLAGCGGDAGQNGRYRVRVLTGRRNSLVATIADHIIPETDTPGASAVHVDRFIDQMLAGYYREDERELFLAGLDEVDERAEEAHGSPFLDCTAEQQRALLVQLDEEAFSPREEGAEDAPAEEEPAVDVRARTEGGATPLPPEMAADTVQWIHGDPREPRRAELPFFRTMKELTVVGYYTSEVGATVELRHEAVPGRHEGCIPYERVGRTWAV